MLVASDTTVRRQVSRGRPRFLLPCGFQSIACLGMWSGSLHSVWPIHFHLRRLIWRSIGLSWQFLNNSSLEMVSGQGCDGDSDWWKLEFGVKCLGNLSRFAPVEQYGFDFGPEDFEFYHSGQFQRLPDRSQQCHGWSAKVARAFAIREPNLSVPYSMRSVLFFYENWKTNVGILKSHKTFKSLRSRAKRSS